MYRTQCNSKCHPYSNDFSDWRQFFAGQLPAGGRWGLTSVIPSLANLQPGEFVLAYQTDRNELVGLTRVTHQCGAEVHLEAIEEWHGLRVRSLKQENLELTRIPALGRPARRTLCAITETDAQLLVDAARAPQVS